MIFDTGLLRTFHAVAEHCSFTKAAGQLNLTQSAVSAQIFRLEQQAGKSLLMRDTRNVSLTPQGEVLLGYARAILRLNGDAFQQLQNEVPTVHVRVGATDEMMCGWLPEELRKLRRNRSHITVEVHVNNAGRLLEKMDRGELDLVLGCRCHGDQNGEVLWREDLVWASCTTCIDTASPLPLALFPDPCPYRDAALAALAAAGREYRIAIVSPSIGAIRNAVNSGLAISPISRSALVHGMHILDSHAGLPELPLVEFVLHQCGRQASEGVLEFVEAIRAARSYAGILAHG